jgi:hypothetical protein
MVATTEMDTKGTGSATRHDEWTNSTEPFAARDGKVGEAFGTQRATARLLVNRVSDNEEPPSCGDSRAHGEPFRVTDQEF